MRLRSQVIAVEQQDGRLSGVRLDNGAALGAGALFICIGGSPRTGWAEAEAISLDARGYILTGRDLLLDGRRPDGWSLDRDPFPLETSLPGLFAAGDVRSGSTKRVGSAVGEGAMAVAQAFQRLAELERQSSEPT